MRMLAKQCGQINAEHEDELDEQSKLSFPL